MLPLGGPLSVPPSGRGDHPGAAPRRRICPCYSDGNPARPGARGREKGRRSQSPRANWPEGPRGRRQLPASPGSAPPAPPPPGSCHRHQWLQRRRRPKLTPASRATTTRGAPLGPLRAPSEGLPPPSTRKRCPQGPRGEVWPLLAKGLREPRLEAARMRGLGAGTARRKRSCRPLPSFPTSNAGPAPRGRLLSEVSQWRCTSQRLGPPLNPPPSLEETVPEEAGEWLRARAHALHARGPCTRTHTEHKVKRNDRNKTSSELWASTSRAQAGSPTTQSHQLPRDHTGEQAQLPRLENSLRGSGGKEHLVSEIGPPQFAPHRHPSTHSPPTCFLKPRNLH